MFVGRKEEGRAVLLSVRAGRGVVLAAPPGYGKTALLRELLPALEAWAPVVWADRVAPFGTFLKDLYRGLRILEEALGARDPLPLLLLVEPLQHELLEEGLVALALPPGHGLEPPEEVLVQAQGDEWTGWTRR
jgi:hypothetical protein